MRFLILLCFLFSAISTKAGGQVWVSWYNRYESAYYMGAHSELDWKWIASRPTYASAPRYWLTTWQWVNGNLQPGFPSTSYSPFPTGFNNCYVSYWVDNGNTLISDSTTTNVSVKADAQGATIRFYLNANIVDEEAHFLHSINLSKDITVAPNGTYYGNPFAGYNYNSGSLSWINLL